MTDNGGYLDGARSAALDDVGGGNMVATTLVGADTSWLVIVDADHLGQPVIDPHCRGIAHEQTGPLPLSVVKRIAITQRIHRCGRPTQAGTPCRIKVRRLGDPCARHHG